MHPDFRTDFTDRNLQNILLPRREIRHSVTHTVVYHDFNSISIIESSPRPPTVPILEGWRGRNSILRDKGQRF